MEDSVEFETMLQYQEGSVDNKDFIFNTLWTTTVDEDSTSKCKVEIPLTFIWKNGSPFRVLSYDSNYKEVIRINFEHMMVERSVGVDPTIGQSNQKLSFFRKLLIEYQDKRKYGNDIQFIDKPKICTVFFMDGTDEDLDLWTLDILLRNDLWCMQVVMIQAFIPVKDTVEGIYSNKQGEKFKLEAIKEKANKKAEDLVKFIERAYQNSTDTMLRGFNALKYLGEEVRIKVSDMVGKFVIDYSGRLIFKHSKTLQFAMKGALRELENHLEIEQNIRTDSSAYALERELIEIMLHAERRNLTIGSTFDHFDSKNEGFINASKLMEGFSEIGIGATLPVCERLVENIGGIGARFFGIAEFVKFYEKTKKSGTAPIDWNEFFKRGQSSRGNGRKSQKTERVQSGKGINDIFDIGLVTSSINGNDNYNDFDTTTMGNDNKSYVSVNSMLSSSTAANTTFNEFTMMNNETKAIKDVRAIALPLNTRQPRKKSKKKISLKDMENGMAQIETLDDLEIGSDDPKVDVPIPLQPKRRPGSAGATTNRRNNLVTSFLGAAQSEINNANNDLKEAWGEDNTNTNDMNNHSPDRSKSRMSSRRASRVRSRSAGKPQSSESTRPNTGDSVNNDKFNPSSFNGMKADGQLDLGGLYEELTTESVLPPDQVLHIDSGVMMTYRVARGENARVVQKKVEARRGRHQDAQRRLDTAKEKRILNSRKKAMLKAKKNGEKIDLGKLNEGSLGGTSPSKDSNEVVEEDIDRSDGFTLILIPDLMMTLNTMQKAFEALRSKFPDASIVYAGLPGLPNSHWPRGWVLNADLHARSLAVLVQFLVDTERISTDPNHPIIFMSFGTGCYSLSRFVGSFLPAMLPVYRRTRLVTLAGGFVMPTTGFKRVLTQFRDAIFPANEAQTKEMVASLYMWDEYMDAQGRDQVKSRFWSTRNELMAPGWPPEEFGSSLLGVHEQIRGLLIGPDDFDPKDILELDVPLLVIQGTENIFVDPRHALMFRKDHIQETQRVVVNEMSSILQPHGLHVCWLKAGHELLLERLPFMLAITSRLVQMMGVIPGEAVIPPGEESPGTDIDELFDPIAEQAKKDRRKKRAQDKLDLEALDRLRQEEAKIEALKKAEKEREEEAKRQEERLRQLEEEKKKNELEKARIKKEKAEEAARLARIKQEEMEQRRKMLERAKKEKAALKEERKRRELEAAREKEMARLREQQRLQKERRAENKEMHHMQEEDKRSRQHEEYLEECARKEAEAHYKWTQSAEYLAFKQEEAVAAMEEQQMRERIDRLHARMHKTDLMRHEIEAFKDYLMNDLKKAQAEGPVQLDEGPLHKVERLKKEEKDRKLREKIEKELKAKADAEEIQRKRREEEEARKRKRWFGFGSKAASAKKVSGGGWFGRKKNNPTSDTSDSEASNGSNGSGTIAKSRWGMLKASTKLGFSMKRNGATSDSEDEGGYSSGASAKSRWGMLKASTKMGFSMKNNGATSDSEDEGGYGSSPAPSPDGKAHTLSEKTGLKAKKNWDKVKAGSKWGFNLFGPSKKQLEQERVKAEEEAREAAFAMAKEAEKAEREARKQKEKEEDQAKKELARDPDLSKYQGRIHPEIVAAEIVRTESVLHDWVDLRRKLCEAKLRCHAEETRSVTHVKEERASYQDMRRMGRAVELVRQNPALVGVRKGEDATMEMNELKAAYHAKEHRYEDLKAKTYAYERQLKYASLVCDKLNLDLVEAEKKMTSQINTMLSLEDKISKVIRDLKMDREVLVMHKDKNLVSMRSIDQRLEMLDSERRRIKDEKGDWVDTIIYVEGVLQRCRTEELRVALKGDVKANKDRKRKLQFRVEKEQMKIIMSNRLLEKLRRDCDKVSQATIAFRKGFKKMLEKTVDELVAETEGKRRQAEVIEEQRMNDMKTKKKNAAAGAVTATSRILNKDPALRNSDEKKYMGFDMILNPGEYRDVESAEIDTMRWDDDYHCNLSRSDLERIKKLPEQINLALPFLHNLVEVDIHRLMNKYYKNVDDTIMKQRDYDTYAPLPPVKEEEIEEDFTTTEFGNCTETVHEVLLDEAQREHLRLYTELDHRELSKEDKAWLRIDRILSPHVYHEDERKEVEHYVKEQDHPTRKREMKFFKRTTKNKKVRKRRKKRPKKRKIDMTQEELEELEEDDDDFIWACPFDRDTILHIMEDDEDNLVTADEKMTRTLLDHYFVPDEDTIVGHDEVLFQRDICRAVEAVLEHVNSTYETHMQEIKEGHKILGSGDTGRIKRAWGGCDQVHPASQGHESQNFLFRTSLFSATRDHPASYGVQDQELLIREYHRLKAIQNKNEEDKHKVVDYDQLEKDAMEELTGAITKGTEVDDESDPNKDWLVVEDVRHLAQYEKGDISGKTILVAQGVNRLTVFEEHNATILARQSRSHRFDLPDRDDARILNLSISVTFQGSFGDKGYKLGRLAVALFRLPDDNDDGYDPTAIPKAIGYAPYESQAPNSADTMGRILIHHNPRATPLKPGGFRIIVGGASETTYNIQVQCRYARVALPVLDELIDAAKSRQQRLPNLLQEIEWIEESIELAERKKKLLDEMIAEAEARTTHWQEQVMTLNEVLEEDNELMTMSEDEREGVVNERDDAEADFSNWTTLFGSRIAEKEDVEAGIDNLKIQLTDKLKEKEETKKQLQIDRRDLPSAMALLRPAMEAVNVAASLNTALQGGPQSHFISTESGAAVAVTPAEEIRKHLRRDGWTMLSVQEKQWCLMDQALNPYKYEWLREKREEMNAIRAEKGRPPKKEKYPAHIDAFRMSKVEIEYILGQPFSNLNRKEVVVRKLLAKYHDDKKKLRRAAESTAFGFDPHLAERVRAKDVKAYTKEEKEWATVDKVLFSEVWRFYTHNTTDLPPPPRPPMENAKTEEEEAKEKAGVTRQLVVVKDKFNDARQGQVNNAKALGKIMGLSQIQDDASAITGNLNLEDLADQAGRTLKKKNIPKHHWYCPFQKDELLRIWRTPPNYLVNEDERKTHKLLSKYNGSYHAYLENSRESARRAKNVKKMGSHIKYHVHADNIPNDVDLRSRQLLRELKRATVSKNQFLDSKVMQATDQRFEREIFRKMVEHDLTFMLTEQVKEREKLNKMRLIDDDDDGSSSDDSAGEDGDGKSNMFKRIQKAQAKKEKERRLKGDDDPKAAKKAAEKAKKIGTKGKTGEQLAMAMLLNELGVDGCLACRARKCHWEPTVDVEFVQARIRILNDEQERVRADKESPFFESQIALSAQLGGNVYFRRMDLLEELSYEARELQRRLDLNSVDKELHDAYASRSEHIEVRFLHGYPMMLWTTNARRALQSRQHHLVAVNLAVELVDDILDWMLEGWYFGERESKFTVAGYVPSIKSDGFIKAGNDQLAAIEPAQEKMRHRYLARKNGVILDTNRQGTRWEKSAKVDRESQFNKLKVEEEAKKKEQDHLLNETETTMKFGLFMMTLMYFRAMAFVKREQETWSGDGDEISGKKKKPASDERMKMHYEEHRYNQRKKQIDFIHFKVREGQRIKKEREDEERKRIIVEQARRRNKKKLEEKCSIQIQRLYRGHKGRRDARTWALKKAEINAINALLNQTATKIQSYYRGYRGRLEYFEWRMIMAQFMAEMRAMEADDDEEQYWSTHPYTRFKRDAKQYLKDLFTTEAQRKQKGGARLSREEQEELDAENALYSDEEVDASSDESGEEDDEDAVAVSDDDDDDEDAVAFSDDDYEDATKGDNDFSDSDSNDGGSNKKKIEEKEN